MGWQMKKYSSTDIKTFTEHCPKALEFAERNTPRDTSQLDYGVASHAVIEAAGRLQNAGVVSSPRQKENTANTVCEILITEGRTFRGMPQPPMSPENAFEGKRVALAYLENNDLPDNADYEIELEHGRFKALHDCVWTEYYDDEYESKTVIVTRDWKGWQGLESELDTFQRKFQAVTLWGNYPEADEIRLEICNLQLHRIWDRTITLDDDGVHLLTQWETELEIICRAADKTREARPGAGCLSCPYSGQCKSRIGISPRDITDDEGRLADYLVYLEVERANTIKALKASQELPVEIEKGYVGWKEWPDNKPTADAYQKVAQAWEGDINGLLKALKLSTGNINAAAKVIFGKDNDAMKQDFLDECIEQRNGKRFGVWEK